MQKKYKYPLYRARFKFDRVAILKDFKDLKSFQAHYGISRITYERGIAKLENRNIPKKYFIDLEKITDRVYLGENVVLTKNLLEATHILEIKDGKLKLITRRG